MKIRHIGMTYVKCTRFLDVQQATVAEYGITGDREFVLLDDDGRPLGPNQHGLFMPLEFDFCFRDNRLALHYPDGGTVTEELSVAENPRQFDYMGMRDISLNKVLGPWDRLLSEFSGLSVRLFRCERSGSGIDVLPISLVTTGSLNRLATELGAAIDHRRFRTNLVIEHDEPHQEDAWQGATLYLGSAILKVRSPVPRCAVTQLNPDSGKYDTQIIPALCRYRDRVTLPDGLMPGYATPGFASYAEVVKPGDVAIGDTVSLST